MQTPQMIWQNGNMVPWSEAKVHVLSHTLHYGGGALEGIRFYKTPNGTAIFRLKEHIDRLFYSANVLNMAVPYSNEEISDAIQEVVAASGLESGYIRPLFFYGFGKLSINPTGHPVECVIACWPFGSYFGHEQIDVKVSSYLRLHPQSTVIDAKVCAHYLNGILATIELQGTHYHDALYLDHKGYVSEGIGANFFMVKSGTLYTPSIGSILVGITRDTIIALAKKLNIPVIEKEISLADVYSADEAFFTGTAAEVSAIRSLNDKPIGDGSVGKMTRTLKAAYLDIVEGRDDSYSDYLTFIIHRELEKIQE